jgi:hypothetical protein
MTYRFLCPQIDGSVIDVAIEADDLQAAVDDFADNRLVRRAPGRTCHAGLGEWRGEADVAEDFLRREGGD